MKKTAEIFKMFSVDTRLRIINFLRTGPKCVYIIAENLKLSQPVVSQHLRTLKSSGLVIDVRKGYTIHYSLNQKKIKEMKKAIERTLKQLTYKERKSQCLKRKKNAKKPKT